MAARNWLLLAVGLSLTACSGPRRPGSDGGTDDPADGSTPSDEQDGESDGPQPQPDHALGTITLGESHPATGGGTVRATLTASFVPDAAAAGPASCTERVAGCEIQIAPDCPTGCGEKEFCTFDSSCSPVCERVCDADCGDDEVCYFPSPGMPGCRDEQPFHAGALTFSGTTAPVTLLPPYSFDGNDSGSLFSPGAEYTVEASGASGAGFEPFERSASATTFIETKVEDLHPAEVFGDGSIDVEWTAGMDEITIRGTATGADRTTGTFVCEAEDAEGRYAIPREVIAAAIDDGSLDQLTLQVVRSRTEVHRDLETTGSLVGQEVQPVGWLELTTQSTESHAFQGCPGGEVYCGGECTDLSSSEAHCGECGNECASSDSCESRTCSGPAACETCAADGTNCTAEKSACREDADCAALSECINECTTRSCIEDCAAAHPDGQELYLAVNECLCNEDCATECRSSCR